MGAPSPPGSAGAPGGPAHPRRLVLHFGGLAVELEAGALWPLVATALIVAWLAWARSWRVALPVGAAVAVSWYASVVAHEVGHALVLRAVGGRAERICLGTVGAVHAPSPLEPGRSLCVALAGPGANLVLGALGWPLLAVSSPVRWWWVLVGIWSLVNTAVAVRNLVPSDRTDGAQALQALRELRSPGRPPPPA